MRFSIGELLATTPALVGAAVLYAVSQRDLLPFWKLLWAGVGFALATVGVTGLVVWVGHHSISFLDRVVDMAVFAWERARDGRLAVMERIAEMNADQLSALYIERGYIEFSNEAGQRWRIRQPLVDSHGQTHEIILTADWVDGYLHKCEPFYNDARQLPAVSREGTDSRVQLKERAMLAWLVSEGDVIPRAGQTHQWRVNHSPQLVRERMFYDEA